MAIRLNGSVDVLRLGDVTLHSYASPEDGEFVRSQIVEMPNSVVVIDVQYLRRYAQEVRAYVDALAKPIERVIISHMHPDHWFGIEAFADAPLYALPEVIAELEMLGNWWISIKKPEFGDQILDSAIIPTHALAEGLTDIDGVQFHFTRVAGAEATHIVVTELPQYRLLLPQDLVYNQIYLFVGELHGPERRIRCFDGWISALEALRQRNVDTVVPGHGAPTTPAIFDTLIAYLNEVHALLDGATSGEDFKQQVMARYPDHRLPLMLDFSVMTLFAPAQEA